MKQRPAILASSGVQSVLLRDYLDKQHSHDDLSVVPKFWPPTARDLAEIRIVIQNTTGFAGIALTRRGLGGPGVERQHCKHPQGRPAN